MTILIGIILTIVLIVTIYQGRKAGIKEKLNSEDFKTIKEFLDLHKLVDEVIIQSAITGEPVEFIIERRVNAILKKEIDSYYEKRKKEWDSQTQKNVRVPKRISPNKTYQAGRNKYTYLNTRRTR